MSSQPDSFPGVDHRWRSVPLLGVLVAVLAAGCATGDLPAIKPLPEITAVPAVAPAPSAAVTPRPTEIPGPPAAVLMPIDADEVPGELGGFTWLGTGSGAPWLVPPPDEAVHESGPYAVRFSPPLLVERWDAAWAPVADGTAGAVAGAEQGGMGPVILEGPDRPGTWSLQVDVRFAGGGRCAYYWRLDLKP